MTSIVTESVVPIPDTLRGVPLKTLNQHRYELEAVYPREFWPPLQLDHYRWSREFRWRGDVLCIRVLDVPGEMPSRECEKVGKKS